MNVFFCLRFFVSLILIPSFAFTQNIIKSSGADYARLESDQWSLDKYLWNVAKYKNDSYVKPMIDFNVIDNWQRMGDYLSVSHNGEYFAYTIERGGRRYGPKSKIDSLIVQSVNKPWRLSFIESKPGFFTNDNKQYIFQEGTRLCFLQLDGSPAKYVNGIASYKAKNGKEWLAYKLRSRESEVILLNLRTGRKKVLNGISDYGFYYNSEWFVCQSNSNNEKSETEELLVYQLGSGIEKQFSFVVDYLLSDNGKSLLLKTIKKISNDTVKSLEYVGFPEGTSKIIWSTRDRGIDVGTYNMDGPGEQVVFNVLDSTGLATGNSTINSIWYYKKGMNKASVLATNEAEGIGEGLQIAGDAVFTDNGRYIQFILQDKSPFNKTTPNVIAPEIWSSNDLILRSAESELLKRPQRCNAIVNVESGRIMQFKTEGKVFDLFYGDFAIVRKSNEDIHGDRFWENGYGRDSNWLVSLKDGNRYLLTGKGGNATEVGPFWFSPTGNYLVYFDFGKERCYFGYDLRTGKLAEISMSNNNGSKELGYIEPHVRSSEKPEEPVGPAAWLKEDAGVLIYDNDNIWQCDLRGRKPAINLTNSFGRSHDIVFSLLDGRYRGAVIPILDKDESLLLTAFNKRNKYSGFYRKVVGVDGDPELLYVGKYFVNDIPLCQDPNLSNKGMQPVKANDVNIWLVQRQTDTDAPNYYSTTDFKSYKRLTNFQPQRGYNWLSEELHSFKHLDGAEGQGILYKPENFDSTKKYPVLIAFYGGYSNNLYQFPVPAYNMTTITPGVSPIWFLNNGYLIFTPDIYVSPLKYGPEAFNVLEGAARYLKQLPYVDGDKLGCSSHSWSAKLGSYMFTHSKSFSAMAISEGFLYANMTNVAFSTNANGESQLDEVEEVFRFGSLWENKDLWLDQTTVLNVNNATSPLLLLCNKKSSEEYQNQTLQLFTALRRLEKRVWWLKYDKGGHTLTDLDERKDFTIRYTQFFDHYLKDAPAPVWMTHGISTKFNDPKTGYELDPVGSCGKDCRICKKWNEQYKRYPGMFDKHISEWSLDNSEQ